jgi:hypothetical protein
LHGCGYEETASPDSSDSAKAVSASLDDTLAYDDNGVTVTMKDLSGLQSFVFEIENHREDDITYMVCGVAVNHCMVFDFAPVSQVTAGNKAVVQYDISGIESYGVHTIGTIDMYISFYNSAAGEIDDPICHAETTIYNGQPIEHNINSDIFYQDDNIDAYILQRGDSFQDIDAVYRNKTDDILSVSVTSPAINGVMLSDDILGYTYILPDCIAYTGVDTGTITLWNALDDEIEAKGLKTVDSLTGKLYISGASSYETSVLTILQ